MRLAVAFDHRGVHLREAVLEVLAGHDVIDFGTDTDAVRIDYPDKAREVGEAIQRGEAERAVLVCGSGVGAAVAACKLTGIRAGDESPPNADDTNIVVVLQLNLHRVVQWDCASGIVLHEMSVSDHQRTYFSGPGAGKPRRAFEV